MSFVHLHVHSEYSLLDGFSNIPKLVKRAKEMGMDALALTDHGTMFGVIEFFNQAKKAGVKPIIGVEAYLASRGMASRDPQFDKKSTHLLLLAENQTGYQNLLKLTSAAQLDGFYYYPRVDHQLLSTYSEGIICTSGCMSAEVPKLIAEDNLEAAKRQLDWYYEVFGKDRFFLELQQHDIPELANINRQLLQLGRRYDAQFVATNDVHYIEPEDARLQDIMLAIQTGTVLSDPNRMRMTDPSYYLRSPQEMVELFAEIPEALSNTLQIAERCNVDLGFKGYRLPNFEVPNNLSAQAFLEQQCVMGLKRRYADKSDLDLYQERLKYELSVINQMGFETYFLIVWDLCRFARERGIWYNARGSAAGSIVAYTLDITLVDPIEHGLIFERFLNPGRISMPDIDLDFPDDRRAEMLEYTARKYGDDRVAQIITFGTLGARAAIRDVGRVMDIPLNEVDRIAKLVPNIPGKPVTIPQALEEVPDFRKVFESAPYVKDLIETAASVEGVVRNAGTHAAGVIISDQPIIEYIPLHRPTGNMANESPIKTVTQFEMNILESLGLLKVDFLGLTTLTIMARACELIYQRHGIRLTLDNIPTDDPGTYELMGKGETAGVFQVESSGMRRWLMEMKPQELKHVVAMVALFRPGPMDFIPAYIKRMHGEEPVVYDHPWMEEIFQETYGYPVYQEQLMFAVMKLAGYSAPEADDLRKAIAKKMRDKLDNHRQKFINGAQKNGISKEIAEKIFSDWEEFARYGFNKSHAVDYAVIAVRTAYLKLHFPVEYMAVLLSVSKNDMAKVATYTADARRLGIGVEPPDVNASGWDFSIEDCSDGSSVIRFGLGAVKNVGQGAVEAIIKAREAGPFRDLQDFSKRVDLRLVGRRALECLTKVGALDSFGDRIAVLESIDRLISISASHFRSIEAGQMSLFGMNPALDEEIILLKTNKSVSRRETLSWEKELIGLYISDHPLNHAANMLEDVVTHFASQLGDTVHHEQVRVAGIIIRIRNHVAKNGQAMAFVTLEDLQGAIELIIFPKTWERVAHLVEVDRIVLVDGKVDTASGDPKILVDNITTEFKKTVGAETSFPAHETDVSSKPTRIPVSGTETSVTIDSGNQPNPVGLTENNLTAGQSSPEYSEEIDQSIIEFTNNLPEPPEAPPDWFSLSTERPELQANEGNLFVSFTLKEDDEISDFRNRANNQELLNNQNQPTVISTLTDAAIQPAIPDQNSFPAKPPVLIPPQRTPSSGEIGTSLHEANKLPLSPLQELDRDGETKIITVVLRASGDRTRDVLRLRRIHGTILSYPGNDRFSVQVFEGGRSYLLEFPNSTTKVCQELLDRLAFLVGMENLRIDPITFQ